MYFNVPAGIRVGDPKNDPSRRRVLQQVKRNMKILAVPALALEDFTVAGLMA